MTSLPWYKINSVFLDMDGTLLDLNFDNHFWQEHVPKRYGELRGLSLEDAKAEIYPRFKNAEGTLDWYCIDYWSTELGLDIEKLKKEVDHLIAVHPHVIDFLVAVKASGRRLLLVTNAHVKSLALKMEQTQLAGYFDHIICSHDLGAAKETPVFWDKFKAIEAFDNNATLLVDDSLPVLRAAKNYGISHLLAIYKPDTCRPANDVAEFNAIHGFDDIMPV
ncbi:MAG: GMP/IMP nucleotidase [Gammaproteobacteria bacterium]|nr:GMP/IMP nucleotidase [Gammaproteobacteria bacterium]